MVALDTQLPNGCFGRQASQSTRRIVEQKSLGIAWLVTSRFVRQSRYSGQLRSTEMMDAFCHNIGHTSRNAQAHELSYRMWNSTRIAVELEMRPANCYPDWVSFEQQHCSVRDGDLSDGQQIIVNSPHLACLVYGWDGLGGGGLLKRTGTPAVRVRFGNTRNVMVPVFKTRIVATSCTKPSELLDPCPPVK